MSYPSQLDARALYQWAVRTVAELAHRRAEINALNVFPVPDADTGSNMAHTMEAALAEADKGGDVAQALAVGSVRGARGNSGMVLSQVLRGVADSTTDSVVTGEVLAQSLELAVRLVNRAIAEPVEGTVLTVLKAAAAAARATADANPDDLHSIILTTTQAARTALERTPSQLEVLREAGVVDAGGTGLVIVLESLLAELEGQARRAVEDIPDPSAELEVVFYFTGPLDQLERELRSLGTSLVIARASDAQAADAQAGEAQAGEAQAGVEEASVHIHSRRAGTVIETAFGCGHVTNLRLEVLPDHGWPAAAPAATAPALTDGANTRSGGASGPARGSARKPPTQQRRVFAAAPAGAVAKLFTSAGATVIDDDTTFVEADGEDIFIVNGSQADAGNARVVSTDSLVAGIAALSVYEPGHPDTDAMVAIMREAARSMRVGYPREQTPQAIEETCRKMLKSGGEQVTILSGVAVDSDRLSDSLGVDVMALNVAGFNTEIGVE